MFRLKSKFGFFRFEIKVFSVKKNEVRIFGKNRIQSPAIDNLWSGSTSAPTSSKALTADSPTSSKEATSSNEATSSKTLWARKFKNSRPKKNS